MLKNIVVQEFFRGKIKKAGSNFAPHLFVSNVFEHIEQPGFVAAVARCDAHRKFSIFKEKLPECCFVDHTNNRVFQGYCGIVVDIFVENGRKGKVIAFHGKTYVYLFVAACLKINFYEAVDHEHNVRCECSLLEKCLALKVSKLYLFIIDKLNLIGKQVLEALGIVLTICTVCRVAVFCH